jgi:acetyl-CoA hydrolase
MSKADPIPAPTYPSDIMEEAIDALKCIRSGDTVLIGSGCAAPQLFVDALVACAPQLYDVEVIHLMTFGRAPYATPDMIGHFRHNAFFTGGNVRDAVNDGRADYTPVHLGEIPSLFLSGEKPLDAVLMQVTPPDHHGYCSLGIDCAITLSAARMAKYIIALVNPQMPRVYGENFLHQSRFHRMVNFDTPLLELPRVRMNDLNAKIGQHVADLIPNGACLQLGIGGIPDAVLHNLRNKKDLGMHTEMFSDGAVELAQEGIINCHLKNVHKDKMVAAFVLGTRVLFDFVNKNPMVEFRPVDHTNDPFVIARNDNMMSINSAISVDITGQVNSDSIGHSIFSGFGGQVDFVRGAARSKGGKPIIALPSTTKDDTVSKVVFELEPGAGVVTSRADVHYIATEFGVAYLHGKTIRERALALIGIAHPKFRDELRFQAKKAKMI